MIDFNDTEIDVNEVSSETIDEIIIYLEHYKNKEPKKIFRPIQTDKNLSDVTDKWDIEFLEKNKDFAKIRDLIVASELLNIPPLHELLCCHIACIIKDMNSAEEVMQLFGIVEDCNDEDIRKMEEEDFLHHKLERDEEKRKKKEQEEMIGLNKTSVNDMI